MKREKGARHKLNYFKKIAKSGKVHEKKRKYEVKYPFSVKKKIVKDEKLFFTAVVKEAIS